MGCWGRVQHTADQFALCCLAARSWWINNSDWAFSRYLPTCWHQSDVNANGWLWLFWWPSFYRATKQPIPGLHNSQAAASPGRNVVMQPYLWGQVERYLKEIIGHFAHDERIVIWDLYNEPTNRMIFTLAGEDAFDPALEEYSHQLMEKAFIYGHGRSTRHSHSRWVPGILLIFWISVHLFISIRRIYAPWNYRISSPSMPMYR